MIIPADLSLWIGALACALAIVFSSTRLALINLSGGMVRRLEEKDKELAERLDYWLEHRDDLRLLLRLLLGLDFFLITLCFASWENHCLANSLQPWTRFTPPLVGLVAFLTLTEFVGWFMSTHNTARFLGRTIPFVLFLGLIISPVALPIRMLRNRLLNLRQMKNQDEEEAATAEDEIMSLVEQDEDDGDAGQVSLEADERRMIKGVFDLDETLVREIMTPRVDLHAMPQDASVPAVKTKIVRSGHSRIPIYKNSIDEIVGVVYAKDLLDEERVSAAAISDLCHPPVFIPETKNVGDLLAEFQQNNNHFAIVLDEYGGTSGVVSFEDILEEIVGDIRDEYDVDEQAPEKEILPDGSVVLDARTPICEINEAMDLDLPEDDDFDTLGGFISALAGHIPAAGEKLSSAGCEIEVLEADPRRVVRVRLRKLADTDETQAE